MRDLPPDNVAEQLRRCIYAGIRGAIDRNPLQVSRTVVVQVLAAMASEQAKIIAEEQAGGLRTA